MIDLKDRLLGGLYGLYGLLIGDAAGVPYEFKRPDAIPSGAPFANLDVPAGYKRTYPRIAPGTWSDDGSQALILLESLLEADTYDHDLFTTRLISWMDTGYMAVDNNRFDIGTQTKYYLNFHKNGYDVDGSFTMNDASLDLDCGNGSLMRSLPVALFFERHHDIFYVSEQQSEVTHPQIIGLICCVLYNRVAQNLLNNVSMSLSWTEAIEYVTSVYSTTYPEQLKIVLDGENVEATGSGYVVDALWSAMYALISNASYNNGYEAVIRSAIALGNDTDTTACIAGGLAGIYYGYSSIPQSFVDALRGKELLEPILAKLLIKRGC